MNGQQLGGVIVGLCAFGVGSLIFLWRDKTARFMAKGNRDLWGQKGDRIARSSTPRLMAVVSIGWMVLGLLILTLSIIAAVTR